MVKSRILIVLFLSIVHTSTANSDLGLEAPLPQSPTGDINAALSCILFGNQACHVECTLTSQLYGYKKYGTCLQDQSCLCRPSSKIPTSLYKEWKTKFDSGYVFNQITRNNKIAYEALQIMGKPLATGEELKRDLKPLLSPYQYSLLKIKGSDLASEFIKNGIVDEKAVRNHISNQLDKYWQYASNDRSLLNADYQDRFRQTLESIRDRGTLYNYAYKVARLQNKTLQDILEEYLGSKGIETFDVELDKEPDSLEVLHFLIINEFMKRNDVERKQKGDQKTDLVKSPSSTRLTRRF